MGGFEPPGPLGTPVTATVPLLRCLFPKICEFRRDASTRFCPDFRFWRNNYIWLIKWSSRCDAQQLVST